jgi:hypothetical protein
MPIGVPLPLVRPGVLTVKVTPVADTAGAYTSGDLIGDKLTLASAVDRSGSSGLIQSVTLVDLAKQNADIDVVFFLGDPSSTTFTDQAALDIADADMSKIIGYAQVLNYASFNDNAVGFVGNLVIPFVQDPSGGDQTIYAALVCRGTPTYVSASDLVLTVGILPV